MAETAMLLCHRADVTEPEPPGEPEVSTSRTTATLDLGDSPGIYEAVLVATFGGVAVSLSKRVMLIHPIFMLLLCLPVFVIQVSTIFILRSDLNIDRHVYEVGNSHSECLLKLKLALVIIVYLTNFKVLVHGVERFLFVSNPITWVEVKHFEARKGMLLKHLPSCLVLPSIMVCPFCSIIMELGVAYLVCVDSVSIILSAEKAQDAIFNSLAISFVVDLGDSWWKFVQHNFKLTSIDNFEFALREQADTWTLKGELQPKTTILPTAYTLLVRATTLKCFGQKTSFLRTGFGAARLNTVTALILLCVIYTRQFFVVLYSVETKTLPAARDLCEEYNLMLGDSIMWDFFQGHMLVSLDTELRYAENNTNLTDRCREGGDLQRMKMTDIKHMFGEDPSTIMRCLALMFCVIVMPSVSVVLHGLILRGRVELNEVDQEQNTDIDRLQDELRQVKKRLDQHGIP